MHPVVARGQRLEPPAHRPKYSPLTSSSSSLRTPSIRRARARLAAEQVEEREPPDRVGVVAAGARLGAAFGQLEQRPHLLGVRARRAAAQGRSASGSSSPAIRVAKYEPLLEVITDKVNAEVPSPFAGVLKEILVEEGATVPNNAEIAVIETADEERRRTAAAPAPPSSALRRSEPAAAPAADAPAPRRRRTGHRPPPEPAQGPRAPTSAPSEPPPLPRHAAPTAVATDGPGNADARMTPAVRRLLREHGLSAAQIVGTGGGGRITREDVTELRRVAAHRASRSAASRRPPRRGPGPGTPHPRRPRASRPASPTPAPAAPAARSGAPTPATIQFPPAPTRSSSRRPRCARASPRR